MSKKSTRDSLAEIQMQVMSFRDPVECASCDGEWLAAESAAVFG